MDILEIFNKKVVELGEEEVAKALEIPKQFIRQFVKGVKSPNAKTCQRVINLWANGSAQKVEEGDGEVCKFETDEHGAYNFEFVPAEWGTKKAKWQGRDVCLCLPGYNDVPPQSLFSMLCLALRYREAMRLNFRGDDSMIARSRNQLAKRFLDTGATWSIWLDSDMVFPIGHAGIYGTLTGMKMADKFLGMKTVERLISWNKTMVGGCYWDRRGSGKMICATKPDQPLIHPIPSDQLHAVSFVGTGCLAAHRQVYLDIVKKFPDTMHPDSIGNECGFFTPIQTTQRMLGEDESFAWRATEAGHPTFLDLGLICGHIGRSINGLPARGSRA